MSFSDNGIGIPAEEQKRLFSRFFRSSLAVADEIQGTGLGLALVQTVVDWHDGTIEMDSVEGEGTTVTVRLPQASLSAPREPLLRWPGHDAPASSSLPPRGLTSRTPRSGEFALPGARHSRERRP